MATLKTRLLRHLSAHPQESGGVKELAASLRVRTRDEFHSLREAMDELEREGKLTRDDKGRVGYRKSPRKQPPNRFEGQIRMNRRGEGFVRVEGKETEIHIGSRFLRTALHGDKVEISLFAASARGRKEKGDQREEGEIIRVVSRAVTRMTGTLEVRKNFAFVVPDDRRFHRDVYVDLHEARTAMPGDKVVVELEPWDDEHLNPEGRILEVLGPGGDVRVEVLSVARSFGLPAAFPPDVESEAARFAGTISAAELDERLDLRSLVTFTIDPEDAKDFDDAISLEVLHGGLHRLGVHIADVSHYVREGTPLDDEARSRGTSVYLVNAVIPMLPERLSNNLCSLRPHEDRLTYSVLMDVTPDGTVKNATIARTVIRSRRRFTYEEAQQVIESRRGDHAEVLLQLHALTRVLYDVRRKNGSIDFDTAEAKFRFDAQGLPTAIIKKVRLDSHRLVEECMLLANRIVAEHIGRPGGGTEPRPFLYRVHDIPNPDRLADLGTFVKKFGFSLDVKHGVSSRELQKLMDRVRGSEVENLITEVALRSMAKAVYAEKNLGHYGLAFRHYTHFTSPIRRYPDLVVHRLLDEYGRRVTAARLTAIRKSLPAIALQSSERERVAMDAERASVKVMQMEYMKRHLGDELQGVISGVTEFGLFVEIEELLIQGLVRMRDMADDYYVYDEKHYALRGRSRGAEYRLGDRVRVKVLRVDPETRELDFTLVGRRSRNF